MTNWHLCPRPTSRVPRLGTEEPVPDFRESNCTQAALPGKPQATPSCIRELRGLRLCPGVLALRISGRGPRKPPRSDPAGTCVSDRTGGRGWSWRCPAFAPGQSWSCPTRGRPGKARPWRPPERMDQFGVGFAERMIRSAQRTTDSAISKASAYWASLTSFATEGYRASMAKGVSCFDRLLRSLPGVEAQFLPVDTFRPRPRVEEAALRPVQPLARVVRLKPRGHRRRPFPPAARDRAQGRNRPGIFQPPRVWRQSHQSRTSARGWPCRSSAPVQCGGNRRF